MPIDRFKLARDYFLVVTFTDRQNDPWGWQIKRKSAPLGVRFYRDGFKTRDAAKIAGEKALTEFLDRLCGEGNGAS